ncbi:hypothetical protein Y032_0129g1491 [Ancylostoma ceylanicum]|uniref:guanylate cyclase n=1 Tax=Ancylostoma ceylanicum TaxID=53326 RepID=A0A016T6U4_9BILA|nr:hypothetical protein Y032_0129g1491 [Ancylostoma ceylanicum]
MDLFQTRSQSFISSSSVNNSKVLETQSETDRMCYFYRGKDALAAFKHSVMLRFEEHTNAEFRKMRQIEHDNLNRFVGIAVDNGMIYSLWRFCARGTLQGVITKGSLPMDTIFIQSMMMDIASVRHFTYRAEYTDHVFLQGLNYIHESSMTVHGRLTSQNCVVDDRWQVKVSYYGMSSIKEYEQRTLEEQLWTAPELLRGEVDDVGTKEADVYSFAIIASEMITKKPAWDLDNRKESAKGLFGPEM